jgi:hypothetical protein
MENRIMAYGQSRALKLCSSHQQRAAKIRPKGRGRTIAMHGSIGSIPHTYIGHFETIGIGFTSNGHCHREIERWKHP